MYFLWRITHTCVRTHQEACVFLSERHMMQARELFQSSVLGTVRGGSSTDCILNVVAQKEEIFSLDLAEHIVLSAEHVPLQQDMKRLGLRLFNY